MRGEFKEMGQMRLTQSRSARKDENKASREVDKDDKDVSGRENGQMINIQKTSEGEWTNERGGGGKSNGRKIAFGTIILQWYYLVELSLDGHLLVAGGAGEMVDAPGLV